VKQITEIDDPRLVKALAHPLRISILRVLNDRVASPRQIAQETQAPLGNVSYHVRYLQRVGLLQLVETRARRGAVEHYYKPVGRVRITDRAWAKVPSVVKNAMLDATLAQAVTYARSAADGGGFDPKNAHLSRQPMTVDRRGFAELAAATKQLLERANEIEAESARRIAESDHREDEIDVGLILMLFEASPEAAVPATDHPRSGRDRQRRRQGATQ
jgi:DNA-binding transcriptional ArsR family regulator